MAVKYLLMVVLFAATEKVISSNPYAEHLENAEEPDESEPMMEQQWELVPPETLRLAKSSEVPPGRPIEMESHRVSNSRRPGHVFFKESP